MPNATQFWDNVADKYAAMPIRDEAAFQYTLERTRSYLEPTDKVLELGCGTGSTALLLADSVGEITGSDIAPRMIQIAIEKAKNQSVENAHFVVSGVIDDRLKNGAPYDAVLAHNLIHLLEDTPSALATVHGLLKQGGTFISKTPCINEPNLPFKWRMMLLAVPFLQLIGKAPSTIKRFTIVELDGAIKAAGFDIIEMGNYPAAPPSRYVVAKKR